MNNRWKEHGECGEDLLVDAIYSEGYDYYFAFLTDQFLSGKAVYEELKKINAKKLLELRLVNRTQEALAVRTMIGADHPFQWRIASEEGLKSDEYIVRYQTLDIDLNHTEKLENGTLKVMTTGGGIFELPELSGRDTIRVISYVGYDQDGMAYIFDNRLAEFVRAGDIKNV